MEIPTYHAIGIDIGGTTTKLALVDSCGEIHTLNTIPTEGQIGTEVYVTNLLDETDQLVEFANSAGFSLQGIGISVAGFIDPAHTKMVFNPNIPALVEYPITQIYEQRFRLPVILEVDSNSATLGEYQFGAGRFSQRFMCLAIGTGVGGGMTIGGHLLRFAYECMGDMGHVIVEPGGPPCNVGCRGCAEAMISAPAVAQHAKRGLSNQTDSDLHRLIGEKGDLYAQDVIEAAKQGDNFAVSVLARTGHWLGVALASLAPLFLPDCIAIAGGVSEAGDLLLSPALETLKTISGDFYHENVIVTKAELGWKATVLGAAVPLLRSK